MKNSKFPIPIQIAVIFWLAGCVNTRSDEVSIETLDSGIVRIIHHSLPDTRITLDTLAVWNLWDENSEYVFNRFSHAAGIPGGFFILDSGNRHIVKLGIDGDAEAVFGREGAGPGEFRYPRYLSIFNDEIWIGDIMLRRYSVFGLDGTYLRNVQWKGSTNISRNGFEVLNDNLVLLSAESPLGPRYLIASNTESGSQDTIVTMNSLPVQMLEIHTPDGRPITMDTAPEFAPELYWSFTYGGLPVTVTSIEYRFEERDISGNIQREILAPAPDLTVTEQDKEWFFQRAVFGFGMAPGQPYQASQEIREKWQFAERRQAIVGIKIDPLGRIWVRANTEDPDIFRMDLFDSDYKYLGNMGDVSMPVAFSGEGYALIRIPAATEEKTDLFLVAALDSRLNR